MQLRTAAVSSLNLHSRRVPVPRRAACRQTRCVVAVRQYSATRWRPSVVRPCFACCRPVWRSRRNGDYSPKKYVVRAAVGIWTRLYTRGLQDGIAYLPASVTIARWCGVHTSPGEASRHRPTATARTIVQHTSFSVFCFAYLRDTYNAKRSSSTFSS